MRLLPCLTWVPQGVAARNPTRIAVDTTQLHSLLQGNNGPDAETSETETEQDARPGLRGSAATSDNEEAAEEADESDVYDMKNYEGDTAAPLARLADVACATSAANDVNVTNTGDDSDAEDDVIEPHENLLVAGRVDKDEYTLETYVFDTATGHGYVHHAYMLRAPPMCLESIRYDPGSQSGAGNLCAVGLMDATVALYDLDLVEAVEPVVSLPKGAEGADGRSKKKKRKEGHTDVVLSLAWNPHLEHILASGGADGRLIFWDLDSAEASTVLTEHENTKLYSLAWHPCESNIIVGGGDSLVSLWDGRENEVKMTFTSGEGHDVEHVAWNARNAFEVIYGTESGRVACVDTRNRAETHLDLGEAVVGLSSNADGAVLVATENSNLHVLTTDFSPRALRLLGTHTCPSLGRLFCAAPCPDTPSLVALGGSMGEGWTTWDYRLDSRIVEGLGDVMKKEEDV